MKTKNFALLIISILFLNACGAVTPVPPTRTATPSPTKWQRPPTPTLAPTATQTPYLSQTPETLNGYPTPPAVIALPTYSYCWIPCSSTPVIPRQAITLNELYLNQYVLRQWCDERRSPVRPHCAVTISSKNGEHIEIWSYLIYFREETGADLTGRGKPNIVIVNYPGGNCCVGVTVYEAGDSLRKIMEVWGHTEGKFTDLKLKRGW